MGKFVDKYIEENRWYITASKLKEFMKSPEQFFLKYIKETPPLKNWEKKYFTIWTAIDDYISYWETKFYQKYYIDQWLRVDEMKERVIAMWVDPKWMTKPHLEDALYWDRSWKIKLTPWDGETVLWCVRELQRQKLFDSDWEYVCQKTYIWSYGVTLKLKGTLDRDSIEMIRDTKSTASLNSFIWEWRDKLWYDVSMCFYWILKLKATKIKSRLIFDVVQKTFPYPSRIFEIPQWEIMNVINQTIVPALDTLDAIMIAYEKTWNEDLWKVKQSDFKQLSSCDMYPIMESAIQDTIEELQ